MSLQDLKKKIPKTDGPGSRAGACAISAPVIVSLDVEKGKRATRVLKSLLDSISDDDLNQVALVWREAMKATKRSWIDRGRDPKTGRAVGEWLEEPDHKTRLEASKLVAAYKEGLPIQRQMVFQGNFKDMHEVLKEIKASPAVDALWELLPDAKK